MARVSSKTISVASRSLLTPDADNTPIQLLKPPSECQYSSWTHSSTNHQISYTHFADTGFGFTLSTGFIKSIHFSRVLIRLCLTKFVSFAQLLRVQSPEGTKRIELLPTATIRELYEAIHDAFDMDNFNFGVFGERNYKNELASSRSQTVDDYKLKHGDMIFMKPLSVGTSSVSNIGRLCHELFGLELIFVFRFYIDGWSIRWAT